jgi:hypothetical protein
MPVLLDARLSMVFSMLGHFREHLAFMAGAINPSEVRRLAILTSFGAHPAAKSAVDELLRIKLASRCFTDERSAQRWLRRPAAAGASDSGTRSAARIARNQTRPSAR